MSLYLMMRYTVKSMDKARLWGFQRPVTKLWFTL